MRTNQSHEQACHLFRTFLVVCPAAKEGGMGQPVSKTLASRFPFICVACVFVVYRISSFTRILAYACIYCCSSIEYKREDRTVALCCMPVLPVPFLFGRPKENRLCTPPSPPFPNRFVRSVFLCERATFHDAAHRSASVVDSIHCSWHSAIVFYIP